MTQRLVACGECKQFGVKCSKCGHDEVGHCQPPAGQVACLKCGHKMILSDETGRPVYPDCEQEYP